MRSPPAAGLETVERPLLVALQRLDRRLHLLEEPRQGLGVLLVVKPVFVPGLDSGLLEVGQVVVERRELPGTRERVEGRELPL